MGDSRFWKVITLVFFLVDLILLSLLVHLRKEYVNISSLFHERQGRIEEILEDYSEVDNDLIQNLLDDECLILDSVPQVFMIIPAYPCSACLDRESALFERFAESDVAKCRILVPDYRLKDARALFSKVLNLSINAYTLETMSDDYWKHSEMIIYFLSIGTEISNIMITSKYSDNASEYYFNHIREKFEKIGQ